VPTGPSVRARSGRDLAGLRRAVQPVYAQLERNPETRSFLRRIQAMKRAIAAPPDDPACAPSASATGAADQQATALDGVYRTSFTRKELANSSLLMDPAEINDQNWGEITLTLDRGRVTFELRNELASAKSSGTFTVHGDAVVFTYTSAWRPAAPSPCAGACIGTCSPSSGTRPSAGRRRRTWSSRGVGLAERDLGQEVHSSARRALDLQPPLQRLDPVGQAARTRTTPRVCAANTVVADLDGHQACPALDPDLNLINYRLRLLHCAMNWQTHRTARLRGRNPRFMA
jgi:hypothetical protein